MWRLFGLFLGKYEIKSFYNPIFFNKESFLGFHESASYCPSQEHENFSAYKMCLSGFFDEHSQNGLLKLENNTKCYVGYV